MPPTSNISRDETLPTAERIYRMCGLCAKITCVGIVYDHAVYISVYFGVVV